jgi:hypothetical protein
MMTGQPGERLRAHLETRYEITVDAMTELDLNTLETTPDARPGGAWHHLADGPPVAETKTLTDMIATRVRAAVTGR